MEVTLMKNALKSTSLAALLVTASACVVAVRPVGVVHRHEAVEYESGGAPAAAEVVIEQEPPAPIVEIQTACPSPNHVWIAGYHTWYGGAFVWVPGCWVLRPPHVHARATWVAGHWDHRGHGYVWVVGCWR
jgi:WXXGXW repeat (2 copies)